MPTILLSTKIRAPIQKVFDAARSIDLHQNSMEQTNEIAIAGRTSGLIQLGETVTWRARHFRITQELTAKITAMDSPYSFTDEMVKGAFHSFEHTHSFEENKGVTNMKDLFTYTSPLGLIGKVADFLFLKRYMTTLLTARNEYLKEQLELLKR